MIGRARSDIHPGYGTDSDTMLTWNEIHRFAHGENPEPARKVEKTEAEWRELLTPDEYRVTRGKGTERPFSSDLCSLFEPGLLRQLF